MRLLIFTTFLILKLITVNAFVSISNEIRCCENELISFNDCCCCDQTGKVFTLYYKRIAYFFTFYSFQFIYVICPIWVPNCCCVFLVWSY